MIIKELKQKFTTILSGIYPSEEVQSFFFLLVEKHLDLSRIQIVLHPEAVISEDIFQKFEDAIQRLKNYEPIQYIIGETEFYGLPFKVDSNVLIPRPETEELVNWISQECKENREERKENREERKEMLAWNDEHLTILDIGTGSGCIAISLAKKVSGTRVTAVDVSEGALNIAKENALNNNVFVNFQKVDILNFEKKPWNLVFKGMLFDVIVSNPPYVREQEKEQIEPNVIDHEPAVALFVNDDDPLLFYRKIAQLSKNLLKTDGILYFEINQYLYKELAVILESEGFNNITLRKDIFGKDRMIKCEKR